MAVVTRLNGINSAETAAAAPVGQGLGRARSTRLTPSSSRLRWVVIVGLCGALLSGVSVAGNPNDDTGSCLPGMFDPAKGVGAGECYWRDEIVKAIQALQQPIVLQANRIQYGPSPDDDGLAANLFTLNPATGEGINFEMNSPLGPGPKGMRAYKATRAYTRAVYHNAKLYDPSMPGAMTAYAQRLGGEAAARLQAAEGTSRLVFVASSGDKQVFVNVNAKAEGALFFTGKDQLLHDLAAFLDISLTDYGRELAAPPPKAGS